MSKAFEKWKAAGMIGAWLMVSDADAKVIWEAAYTAGVQAERERCLAIALDDICPANNCPEHIAAAIRKEAE